MFEFGIAGFPKCGTSSVWGMFEAAGCSMRHGEVDPDELSRLAALGGRVVTEEGFKTATLIYHPRTIERLVAANPRFRLLIGLRDPVEWAWSWYWYWRRSVEDACSPDGPQTTDGQFLLLTPAVDHARLLAVTPMDFIQDDIGYPTETRKHGQFDRFIAGAFERVPANQILLYDLSQLEGNWTATARRCLRFVGKKAQLPAPMRENVNLEKPECAFEVAPDFAALASEYYRVSCRRMSSFLAVHGYPDLSALFAVRAER